MKRQYKEVVIKNRKLGRVKGYLTRNQRIAYNIFLKTAHDALLKNPEQHTFRIGLRDFLELARFDYRNYYSHLFKDTSKQKSLKTFLEELQTKTYKVEWKDDKDEPYRCFRTPLLSQFIIDKNKDYIEFEFPSFIHEAIVTYNNFYVLYLPVITAMKSTYSIALYEQILQRKEFTQWQVSIKDLKELLGINEGTYSRVQDFEIRAIKPAVKEINKITNINLEYIKIKDKRDKRRIAFYKFFWR